jgi:hypothetical protein
MAKPWEKYGQGQPETVSQGTPWAKYAEPAPAAPAIPAAQAPAYREIRKLPGEARLLEGPNGTQVLVAGGFATSDPKQIQQMLKPLEAAEASRA